MEARIQAMKAAQSKNNRGSIESVKPSQNTLIM